MQCHERWVRFHIQQAATLNDIKILTMDQFLDDFSYASQHDQFVM
jgi:hypothetical protein